MDRLAYLNRNAVYGDVEETIKAILICAKMARREGLLSLDEMVGHSPEVPLLFRIGTQLIVDGTDVETVAAILTGLAEAEGLQGETAAEAKITVTGILGIQMGENPRIIAQKCSAHLGLQAYIEASRFTNSFVALEEPRSELPEDTFFGVPMEEVEAREKLGWKFPRLYVEQENFSAVAYLKQNAE